MRICLAVPYYPPELGAASVRAESLVSALANAGHDVVVVTPKPSYFLEKGEEHTDQATDIQDVDHYDTASQDAAGVVVCHTPLRLRSDSEKLWMRLGLEFIASAAAFPSLLRRSRSREFVYVSSPPLTYALAAAVAGRLAGAKVAVEIRDMWPDIVVSTLPKERSRTLLVRVLVFLGRLLSSALYGLASCLVCVTRTDMRRLSRNTRRRKPVLYAPNGADEQALAVGKRIRQSRSDDTGHRDHSDHSRFKIAYAGRLGPAQRVSKLLDAAALVSSPLELTIVGSGPERPDLERIASNLRKHSVLLLDAMPREKVLDLLARQDAVYVPLASKEMNASVPSKLFEAWALGVPVILAAFGEAAQIVREVGGGVIADPDSPASIAQAIEELLSDPRSARELGAKGYSAVLERYRRDVIMSGLFDTVTAMVSPGGVNTT